MHKIEIVRFIEVNKILEFKSHKLLCCIESVFNKKLNFS